MWATADVLALQRGWARCSATDLPVLLSPLQQHPCSQKGMKSWKLHRSKLVNADWQLLTVSLLGLEVDEDLNELQFFGAKQ